MSSNTQSPAVISTWYFIAATFAFAWTSLYPESPLWVRIVSIAAGFVLVAIGGVYLARELGARRKDRSAPPETPSDAG